MVFIVTDAFVLLVAVFRVWRVLRNERMVFVNEKFMALHASLLFFVAVAIFLTYYDYFFNGNVNVWYWTSYLVIDQTSSLLIVYILWRASSKPHIKEI